MFAATIVISSLFAVLIAYSAIRKLSHDPAVVASYAAAGVPERWLDRLALTLIAGATGLLAGLAWAPLGVAAGAALAVYFAVAVGFHIRSGDIAHLGTPLMMLALAVAAVVLHAAS